MAASVPMNSPVPMACPFPMGSPVPVASPVAMTSPIIASCSSVPLYAGVPIATQDPDFATLISSSWGAHWSTQLANIPADCNNSANPPAPLGSQPADFGSTSDFPDISSCYVGSPVYYDDSSNSSFESHSTNSSGDSDLTSDLFFADLFELDISFQFGSHHVQVQHPPSFVFLFFPPILMRLYD
eukprot:Phypoly_transcript_20501.p1 GENE.Phypoly_transcript_20501~~Phypoly_transcript_20501.p1  ORF type:complete len:191 (+),score=24.81 Phypoly_transcript_20501:23-574(+)